MKYQKIINLLDNTLNQPSKFKLKNWVEIKDESLGTYNKDNKIKFTTLMSSLYDHRDAYILFKGTITFAKETDVAPNNANKKIIFKNCTKFDNWISRIDNMQADDAHDIDVVRAVYNLIEYSGNYSNTSWILLKYFRDKPTLADNGDISDFNASNGTVSFNL